MIGVAPRDPCITRDPCALNVCYSISKHDSYWDDSYCKVNSASEFKRHDCLEV